MNNHNSIPKNYDSDQSISEEEDCEGNVHGCWSISLSETTERKGRGQVLSQLEILRDAHGLEHVNGPSITPQKRDKLLRIQDDVDNKCKLSCLADRVSTSTSDEENISDEEVIKENNMLLVPSRIERNVQECTWSAVNKEVEELIHVNENAICSFSSPAVFSKDPRWVDNYQIEPKNGRKYTIMFSSRSCGDIELEVGNVIRIYSPWKEVRVMEKNEIVILSTYFSQIHLINEC